MNKLEGITHAISIRQPWAWLVAAGWQDIENRTWHTNYRGAIAIHASKEADEDVYHPVELLRATLWAEYGTNQSSEYDHNLGRFYEETGDLRNFGAIIGVATVIGCVHEHESLWFTGPHGFVMNNPELFDESVPWRGQLGIWELK